MECVVKFDFFVLRAFAHEKKKKKRLNRPSDSG